MGLPREQVAAGLPWAIASLVLDVIEVMVLTEIIFFDKPRSQIGSGVGFLEYYFAFTVAGTLGQALGVLLVTRNWFISGGILQIVSSATQVVKIDGIVGVIGGIKAYQYGRRLRRQS